MPTSLPKVTPPSEDVLKSTLAASWFSPCSIGKVTLFTTNGFLLGNPEPPVIIILGISSPSYVVMFESRRYRLLLVSLMKK